VNRRLPLIFGVLSLSLVLLVALASVTRSNKLVSGPTIHKVDLFANVTSVNVDSGWSDAGGVTKGAMRLVLDDLRTLTIPEGTMVDNYSAVQRCTDFSAVGACDLVADMLGEGVVWFALVKADSTNGSTQLTLPGLVDMVDGGSTGVLSNGWHVKLINGVKRTCKDTDTSTLREFITKFPDSKSTSIVNLTRDAISEVRCAA